MKFHSQEKDLIRALILELLVSRMLKTSLFSFLEDAFFNPTIYESCFLVP